MTYDTNATSGVSRGVISYRVSGEASVTFVTHDESNRRATGRAVCTYGQVGDAMRSLPAYSKVVSIHQ